MSKQDKRDLVIAELTCNQLLSQWKGEATRFENHMASVASCRNQLPYIDPALAIGLVHRWREIHSWLTVIIEGIDEAKRP